MQICQKKIKEHIIVIKTYDKTVSMEHDKHIMMQLFCVGLS